MGWLDTFWKREEDPLSDLDPSLRRYLENQAPKGYRTEAELTADAARASSSPPQDSYRSRMGLEGHNDPEAQQRQLEQQKAISQTQTPPTTTTPPTVPPESLFPDGRYAHLWSTYRPLSTLESSGKSDQEKLLDVVGGYKERQNQVSKAAIENCADLQFALSECFRTGGWKSRMSMCREENQQLGRCVVMQGKLLRALGYLSLYERSEEESERIQMHADSLFHDMLRREEVAKQARDRGEKEPVFEPLLKGFQVEDEGSKEEQGVMAAVMKTAGERADRGERVSYDSLPDNLKAKLRGARLKGMEGDELVLAKLELEEDIAVRLDLVRKLNDRYVQEKRERDERREKGEERFGDKVKRYFDFRKYPTNEEGTAVPKPEESLK